MWAGFMHRDERYTIPLDQEANKKLSKSTEEVCRAAHDKLEARLRSEERRQGHR